MKKKVLIATLSLIISLPLFMRPVLADTDNSIYSWLYGVYTFEYQKDYSGGIINIPIGNGVTIPYFNCKASQTFNYYMNDYRDGVVTLYYTPVSRLTYLDLFVSGATISSYNSSSGQLVLNINGTEAFSVTFATSNTVAALIDGPLSSSYGTGTTNDVNAPATSLHSIDVKLSTTNESLSQIIGYIDNLESYTDNVETLLTNIRTYSSYIQTMSATTTNIYNDVDTYLPEINNRLNSIISYVDNVENYTDNIETLLQNAIDYVDNIEPIITNIESDLVVLNDNIEQFNFSRSLIYQLVQNNNRYLKVNSSILYGDVYQYKHENNTADTGWTNNFYVPGGMTYSFVFYSVNALTTSEYNIYSTTTSFAKTLNNRQQTHSRVLYEITIANNSGSRQAFSLEFTKDFYLVPIYLGYRGNMPMELQELLNISVGDPYTRKMDEIKSAIQNMAVNVNNMTVNTTGITYNVTNTEVNTSVTNYNTNINQVYNVENNLSVDFDTYNQQFNPDFTDTLQQIQSAPQVMNSIIVDLYDLPFIKYPTLITLAGIVLLALLGV